MYTIWICILFCFSDLKLSSSVFNCFSQVHVAQQCETVLSHRSNCLIGWLNLAYSFLNVILWPSDAENTFRLLWHCVGGDGWTLSIWNDFPLKCVPQCFYFSVCLWVTGFCQNTTSHDSRRSDMLRGQSQGFWSGSPVAESRSIVSRGWKLPRNVNKFFFLFWQSIVAVQSNPFINSVWSRRATVATWVLTVGITNQCSPVLAEFCGMPKVYYNFNFSARHST